MATTPSVGHVLNQAGGGLSNVIRRAKLLRKLTQTLKTLVDAPLCEHIYVANVRDDTLVIGTDSAVWHTRVKYLSPVILEQIQGIKGLEEIRKIAFRVQPFGEPQSGPKTPAAAHPLSQAPAKSAADPRPLKQFLQQLDHKKPR